MEKTVRKAFAILEQLAADPAPQRVTDLASRVGLTKPNTHRLLATLVDLGYAAKDPASRYTATLKLWEIGRGLIADTDLQLAARPALDALGVETRQSVGLAILNEGHIVYIAASEGPRDIRPVVRLGSRIPAIATALGKAMLAWRGAAELDEAMLHVRAFTPLTLTDRAQIEAELERTRGRGYATSRGEFEPGVCAIAAPVFDTNGRAIASVGAWGAEPLILDEACAAIARSVMKAAADISRRVGYVGPLPLAVEPAAPEAKARARTPPRHARRVAAAVKSRNRKRSSSRR